MFDIIRSANFVVHSGYCKPIFYIEPHKCLWSFVTNWTQKLLFVLHIFHHLIYVAPDSFPCHPLNIDSCHDTNFVMIDGNAGHHDDNMVPTDDESGILMEAFWSHV